MLRLLDYATTPRLCYGGVGLARRGRLGTEGLALARGVGFGLRGGGSADFRKIIFFFGNFRKSMI